MCEATIINKGPFLKHLLAHSKKKTSTIHEASQGKNNVSPGKNNVDMPTAETSLQHGKESENSNTDSVCGDGKEPKMTSSRKKVSQTAECPICSKTMHIKSIRRHCKEQHDAELSGATCVDEEEGLFLIRNSSKGGVSYPIHVQKVIGGVKTTVACEVDHCMDTMAVAWRSGITSAECHHLANVGKNPCFPQKINLDQDVLDDLSKNGKHKLLTDERIEGCKRILAVAEEKNKQCVVPMKDGERYIHFSVFHGEVNYFSRFGRVVLSADLSKGTLDCRCCRRKVPCVHKGLVLWYLNQTDILHAFQKNPMTTNEEDEKENEVLEEVDEQGQRTIYPPTDSKIL